MPIHLRTPVHKHGGPDGQGWTRFSIGSLAGDECALRPRTYPALRESQDTRRARYGGFGPCINGGDCDNCPIFQRLVNEPRRLDALSDEVLVRIDDRGRPYLMNRPEQGWASGAYQWTWEDLARLTGWIVAERYSDQHGRGFWLRRSS